MANTTRKPEKEFPIVRQSKVAVWLHAKGRSITVSPPRFKDQQTGEFRDGGFFTEDIPMLIHVLQVALNHCYTTPLPSPENTDSPRQDAF